MDGRFGMRSDFNMLLTTYRHEERSARDEVMAVMNELYGDSHGVSDAMMDVWYTGISGLLACRSSIDPFSVIRSFRDLVREEPWRVRYVLRLIPIEKVVNTSLEEISDACSELASKKISKDESFRITVEKRMHTIHSMEIIRAVASRIDRRVDLVNYDWLVLVEVVGQVTGVAVLKDDDLFSSIKLKRSI
ncbi:MAG: THUMP domain-containing protein [Candidatus Nitrosocaldus sp.]|nr:THUMP domain-containing protein [Candidatus Nitrosocaldus sp.]MDW8275488.1 THUMP domain-containing protein [Candidatus Nitrosocaldus sp.]